MPPRSKQDLNVNKMEDKSLKGYLNIYEVLSDLFSSNQWEMKNDVMYKRTVCQES